MSGPLALLGSGEYLPSMEPIERSLLVGRPPRMAQLATAAAPEGPDSLAYWHELGRGAAERHGVEQLVVPVVDRASADDPRNAALLEGVGLVYLSGGDPTYLAETLRRTAVGTAILRAWADGAALAGCSAGAMALCGRVPSIRRPHRPAVEGLGLLPHLQVVPHYDRFVGRLPGWVMRRMLGAHDGLVSVGIDEETALVGGPDAWEVRGRGSAWLLHADERQQVSPGGRLRTPRPAIA